MKHIALAGNPNCGKTTFFNSLTGGTQRIGNWPGVTVEKKEGTLKYDAETYNIVDLPGIYSLSASSEDEKVARDYLLSGDVDLVVNILDSTNIERNLYLTTQLLEMGVPLLLVMNMMDLAKKKDITINLEELSQDLDVPVIAVSSVNKDEVLSAIPRIVEHIGHLKISTVHTHYPNELEDFIEQWKEPLKPLAESLGANSRWAALKILEEDSWVTEKVLKEGVLTKKDIQNAIEHVRHILKESTDVIIADYRYGFIQSVSKSVVRKKISKKSLTNSIDKVVMNRVLGLPIFFAAMFMVFWVSVNVGSAFIEFFEILFGSLFVEAPRFLFETVNAPQWLVVLLADGIGAGIQTVATFIPIIFFMFFMLSLLEDSGYMARAAFVMDKLMRYLGLPGKAFVSLLVGFGCTVPAIMGTRTLETQKDRFLTIFMTPLMSCGARFPVYALLGAAFFGKQSGAIVFSIYVVGILLSVFTGFLMKGTLFKGTVSHFVMELPPYHAPRLQHILIHTWLRLKIFILRAGKAIILAVMILGFLNSIGTDFSFGNEDAENSVLSSIGKGITPVFRPMGVADENWPATVGLFTGIFAKEAVIGTLNALYLAEADPLEEEWNLFDDIKEAFASIPAELGALFGLGDDDDEFADEGSTLFGLIRENFQSRSAAYAYLLFILIYFPCIAAFAAAIREMGAKLAWLMAAYLTVLAWSSSTLFYQISYAHNWFWIIFALALIFGFYVVLKILGHKELLFKKEL